MRTISFTLPGIAVPWARAGRKGGFSYTPGKQRTAMAEVKLFAQRAMAGTGLLAGPVSVRLIATYAWPLSATKKRRESASGHWKATRPDLSNLVKLIEDALIGVAYTDDGQIASLNAYKVYGDEASLEVTLAEIEAALAPTPYTHCPNCSEPYERGGSMLICRKCEQRAQEAA